MWLYVSHQAMIFIAFTLSRPSYISIMDEQ